MGESLNVETFAKLARGFDKVYLEVLVENLLEGQATRESSHDQSARRPFL